MIIAIGIVGMIVGACTGSSVVFWAGAVVALFGALS